MRSLIALASAALLAGCAAAPGGIVPMETWARQIEVQHDEFRKTRTTVGADAQPGFSRLFLRHIESQQGPAPTAVTQLYIAAKYSGRWHFYSDASDIHGTRLPVTLIDRTVDGCSRYGGCSYTEDVGITLTTDYLRQHLASGIDVRLYGKGGDQTFHVPGPYIEAFLTAIVPKPAAASCTYCLR